MRIYSVLFVGRRNAARSVMAEICFNAAAIPTWRAFSAGWQPATGVDRHALRALAEGGFPSDPVTPKPVGIFLQPGAPQIDLCVFLDTELPNDIAAYPAAREFWRIGDPSIGGPDTGDAGAGGTGRAAYREALTSVTGRLSDLIVSGRLAEAGAVRLAS